MTPSVVPGTGSFLKSQPPDAHAGAPAGPSRKPIGQWHVLGKRPAIRGAPGGRDCPQAL